MNKKQYQDQLNNAGLSGMEAGAADMLGGFISGSMDTAIGLTKLIVKTRIKNGEKLKDADIYEIYQTSLSEAIRAVEESQI